MGHLPVAMRVAVLGVVGLLCSAAARPPATTDKSYKILTYAHQRVDRVALLHRPLSLGSQPAPLVVALHGLGQSVQSLRDWLRMDDAAERHGFNVVYPQAIGLSWSYGKPLARPMPAVHGETVDDIGFIRKMIDDLVARQLVDPERVYVTGMSRGGLMTFTLACALADRIAAAAPLITGMTDHQREECHPARALPLVAVAGTSDRSETYEGIVAPHGRLLSVQETMDFWREVDGCRDETSRVLPHLHEADPTNVRLIEWRDCKSETDLMLYRVRNGGHQLPSFAESTKDIDAHFGLRNHDMDTAEAVWDFFSKFTDRAISH